MTQETKLGAFVLTGLLAFVVAIVLLGDFQFRRTYGINILFNDIAGLPAKANVKIAGVEIGGVKDITLEGNKALVHVWIREGIPIHRDARASIVSTGIIGSKYLELTSGSASAPLIEPGETMVGVDPMSFDQVISETVEQINSLVKSFQGAAGEDFGRNLTRTIENLRHITDSLRVVLSDQEGKLVQTVDNISDFTRDLAEITAQNKDGINAAMRDIRSITERLDVIIAKVEKGEGTIGKLISDEEMGDDLKVAVQDLRETVKQSKNVLRRMNLIETYWDYNLRYDAKYEMYRSDIALKVVPRPGKFYMLGVSNVGDPEDQESDVEKINTFNAVLGRQFGRAEIYAGAIRSKGGLGVHIKPLVNWDPMRRLEVTAEAYDFFRKTPVTKAKINVGAKAWLADWVAVGAQLEDISYATSLNVTTNLFFRDDDIAYVLGLAGLAQ